MNLVWRALNYERGYADRRNGIVTVQQPVMGYEIVEGEVHERLGEPRSYAGPRPMTIDAPAPGAGS